jgi:hypothetical protein
VEVEIRRNCTYSFGGSSGFVCCYFFHRALDFNQVDVLVAQLDNAGENGLDLGFSLLVHAVLVREASATFGDE